ncbi:stress response protein nst1-like isoform X4 [Centruroides sculpturatus]|uniref:stress response protein nst1-like isoform X4 n=1 Tax=Centruroides sculpturatus TaxID=218467 RepID=UPI000C6E6AD1|nr:stress response protein nst1-like isoform X4 [Centruroides sculpturatus]
MTVDRDEDRGEYDRLRQSWLTVEDLEEKRSIRKKMLEMRNRRVTRETGRTLERKRGGGRRRRAWTEGGSGEEKTKKKNADSKATRGVREGGRVRKKVEKLENAGCVEKSIQVKKKSREMSGADGVDLNSIEDEVRLYEMLDATEDFDERKKIRARLKEVQTALRAKRDEMMRKREEERERAIRERFQEAAEQKKRTLAMYDQMAKSSPAGGPKTLDVNTYKNADGTTKEAAIPAPKRDLVEEGIQQRKREADERKRRILAAYDAAAKSGAPGPKSLDIDTLQKPEVPEPTPAKPTPSCTFAMSGGIPQISKALEPPEWVEAPAMSRRCSYLGARIRLKDIKMWTSKISRPVGTTEWPFALSSTTSIRTLSISTLSTRRIGGRTSSWPSEWRKRSRTSLRCWTWKTWC